ncbi:DUF1116 domain-containing protein [Serratia sp. DD3]|uniref:DUF1116 domain-containing protein n=1 Tax=Serratia sp. DD3 TaxID=1410619 RepID=UPI0003C4DF32|nr:DUF1116 domain-containing protein [Serratia sp. DD3]KEY59075.1 hypothetical protein SRDD_20230 [Serratia sp. DD3]
MLKNNILTTDLQVVNVGLEQFYTDLQRQSITALQVEWSPPAHGDETVLAALNTLYGVDSEQRNAANAEVLRRMQDSEVFLEGMGLAGEVIPGMAPNMILHAGPPIEWSRMCGTMQGAIIGALLFEGLAKNEDEAKKLAASSDIIYSPNHDHHTVGPMGGIISAHMPVFIMHNRTFGNYSYSNVNEGPGKALRFGSYGPEVIERLHWMTDSLYPILKQAIEFSPGIDWKNIVTQALQMGDDNHNRHKASTSLFVRELAKYIAQIDADKAAIHRVFEHIEKIDMFNVNITMAMCKAMSDAALGVEGSTIVTVMARNGIDFGIRLSSTGNQWFTAPANVPEGLYFTGYSSADACADIGDSAITETFGMGGFALACAPAMVQFIGGTYDDGVKITNSMYEITATENKNFKIPTMGFKGTPTGIDIIKVLEANMTPVITTGISHRDPGVGQIGAGIVNAPMECFTKAAIYLAADK